MPQYDSADHQYVDLNLLTNCIGGGDSQISEMIKLFYVKTLDDLHEMEKFHACNDHSAWCAIAHKLKGSAAYMQAQTLVDLCQKAQSLPVSRSSERERLQNLIRQGHENVYQEMKKYGYLEVI